MHNQRNRDLWHNCKRNKKHSKPSTYMRAEGPCKTTYQSTKPPDCAVRCRSSYKHMVEEEDKPAGKSFMGINPLEPVHDPYRAEFKERLRKPNTCDRDMPVPNKNFLFTTI